MAATVWQFRYRACMASVAPWTADLRGRLDDLLEEYRSALRASVEGVTEEEARARLVPSKTTLLGLLKHVTFVEAVWFDQAVTGRPLVEIGVAASPDRSFVLTRSDSVDSVRRAHERRCEMSRAAMVGLSLGDVVRGRGERTVWALYLQVLRELAQHAGHADILREQVLAGRPD